MKTLLLTALIITGQAFGSGWGSEDRDYETTYWTFSCQSEDKRTNFSLEFPEDQRIRWGSHKLDSSVKYSLDVNKSNSTEKILSVSNNLPDGSGTLSEISSTVQLEGMAAPTTVYAREVALSTANDENVKIQLNMRTISTEHSGPYVVDFSFSVKTEEGVVIQSVPGLKLNCSFVEEFVEYDYEDDRDYDRDY